MKALLFSVSTIADWLIEVFKSLLYGIILNNDFWFVTIL
jgi:hypothetical protein